VVLRIVADDLTGALDTAAPFAAAGAPFPVLWDQAAPRQGSYALDTETRERRTDTYDWVAHLHDVELPFKKIDSLLRGSTAQEITACLEDGAFRSAIIAPAFPAQGRITRGGRQYWRSHDQSWQPVDCDLMAALQERLPVRHAASAEAIAAHGYFFCDAESEEALRALVVAGRRMAKPILWCGSAGLGRTLADPLAPQPFVPRAPLLALIGSHHPISRAQLDALRRHWPDAIVPLDSAGPRAIEAAVERTAGAISDGRSTVLAASLPAGSDAAARSTRAATAALVAARVPKPGRQVVTGGETLHGLLQALGATSLLATGELMPGVPLSRIVQGRWHDLAVVSKSGGFGAPDLLIQLAESVMP
jgi:uncharacterized protein YgbK (DUF1537 family)